MREINFRGKRTDNGEWIYGHYVEDEQGASILCRHPADGSLERLPVDRDTVGQYPGIKDKNGVEIYEGDIIATRDGKIGEVFFDKGMFRIKFKTFTDSSLYAGINRIEDEAEVIGNIHENPELLKKG